MLADGFEEIEALAPVDLLRRAGVEVLTVGAELVKGSRGINVASDISVKDFLEDYKKAFNSVDKIYVLPFINDSEEGKKAIDLLVDDNKINRFSDSFYKEYKKQLFESGCKHHTGTTATLNGKYEVESKEENYDEVDLTRPVKVYVKIR